VSEVLVRLQNAIDPDASSIKVPTVQDVTDSHHTRLTIAQANCSKRPLTTSRIARCKPWAVQP
jgi:hypothetical protein